MPTRQSTGFSRPFPIFWAQQRFTELSLPSADCPEIRTTAFASCGHEASSYSDWATDLSRYRTSGDGHDSRWKNWSNLKARKFSNN